jgi:serine/threonine-protein kinase TNNI3K
MVSEFMHGGDLRSLLMRYALDGHLNGHDDGKLRMAVQVAHALTYLHSPETPVVHRDLKSRNVLLSETMDAKVIDFGISCERQDVTMTAGVGTSLWMAPEVMLGNRYDEKADVFSFGVILSELDTHQLPYDDAVDSVSNKRLADIVMMNKIATGDLKPRFTQMAARDMVALANNCLEFDPVKRPLASEVLYRIHLSRQHDHTMTSATRTAISRSLYTAETSARTRNSGVRVMRPLQSRPPSIRESATSAGRTDTGPFLTA